MVLFLGELHVARSLRRVIRSRRYSVTFDQAFVDVMRGCAEPRDGQDGTWITDAMVDAYSALAALGYAHSVEAWADGVLAGGLYGVAIGRMFFGESMFARRTDASKVALVHLVRQLRALGFPADGLSNVDRSPGIARRAGDSREDFVEEVSRLVRREPVRGRWTPDEDVVESV